MIAPVTSLVTSLLQQVTKFWAQWYPEWRSDLINEIDPLEDEMSIDAKKKIEEILKKKREGAQQQTASTTNDQSPYQQNIDRQNIVQPNIAQPINQNYHAQQANSTSATSVNSLSKINEMLKQRKAESNASTNNQNPTPVHHYRDVAQAKIDLIPVNNGATNTEQKNGQQVDRQQTNREAQPTRPPFGYCRCCRIDQILIATNDRKIICPASAEEYIANADGTVVLKPKPVDLNAANELETALNEGAAAFFYGGFIVNEEPEQHTTQRRRRRG